MFSFFDKNKMEEQDFNFLKNVICTLPTKWNFLLNNSPLKFCGLRIFRP